MCKEDIPVAETNVHKEDKDCDTGRNNVSDQDGLGWIVDVVDACISREVECSEIQKHSDHTKDCIPLVILKGNMK